MVHSPTLRSAAWCIAVVIVLGVLIAGCTESYDRDRDVPSDSGMTQPTGLDVVAADPGSLSASAQRGEQLFESRGCMGCHTVNGQGGNVGPDLSNEGNSGHSTQWLATQIRDPKSHDPQTAMPAFNNLSDQQVNDLHKCMAASCRRARCTGPDFQRGDCRWGVVESDLRPVPQSQASVGVQRRPVGGGGSPHEGTCAADWTRTARDTRVPPGEQLNDGARTVRLTVP
jgi:cytochrome c551/c552